MSVYRQDSIVLDTHKHEVRVAGELVTLTYTQFAVLNAMMQAAGKPMDGMALKVAAHGEDGVQGPAGNVRQHLHALKRKLPIRIISAPRQGWFMPGIEVLDDAEPVAA